MKFIVGFLAGAIAGAVGAVAYSVSTGRDLRTEFEEIRGDLSRGDLDALGTRLETRCATTRCCGRSAGGLCPYWAEPGSLRPPGPGCSTS